VAQQLEWFTERHFRLALAVTVVLTSAELVLPYLIRILMVVQAAEE
jgi:hypothetical protein